MSNRWQGGFVRDAASGALLTSGTTGGGSGAGDPWVIDVNVFPPASATVGAWSAVGAGGIVEGGRLDSDGVQNDSVAWDLVLAAGTWNLSLMHQQNTQRGIYTVAFDGTTLGTIDGYAATSSNVISTMATKNASSTGFLGSIQALSLRRTA